ncbi:fatty acyl-CoA synthetase [Virgibacillus salexigens]|uniref:Acyl-CoA synthetase n=1 Tax=Virgibacillus kapii TaxID=1638645 RepID=A0ABQ2DWL7_9BACI|nr:fatty acyl-CoA synthetase [Virgibacillus kapii]GGJ70541.1 acyl-CoA synthetase [Virgibacillus kapii]
MNTQANVHDEMKMIQRARRNTLSDILSRTAARMPDKNAIAYNGVTVTYKELDTLVTLTAYGFKRDGMGKGDMIIVMSKNSLDFVIVNFALARIGAVMIPINYMLSTTDTAYIIEHAKASGFIASKAYADVLDISAKEKAKEIKYRYIMENSEDQVEGWKNLKDIQGGHNSNAKIEVEIADDDLCHVLYTSGTESRPKGVMLTHKSIMNEYASCVFSGKMESDDIMIHALPLYHSAQLHVFLGPSIYIGCSSIILEKATPELILKTIEETGASQLFCPPTVWIAILRHPDFEVRDLSTLRKCYYGAAIMPREILKELSSRLPNAKFWNLYGQTEVAPLATVLQPEDQLRKIGSAGTPSLYVETRIVNDQDEEVARGEVGEIVHRTPHAMKGYLYDPVKTREAFRNGWFHSGDLGKMDEEGYITIIDRKKDMINTGGINVSSREVEEVIYQLEGVSEVAVISIPDPYWIEAVTAIIVPKKDVTLSKEVVEQFCKEHLTRFKVPKYVTFTDALPKNPSGKVLKRALRDQYEILNKK